MENSPVAYWRLSETSGTSAIDSSGNGRTGTYTGGYTLGQTGPWTGGPDTAINLNGSTGYVTVPHNAALNSTSITLEAWIKPPNANQSSNIITKGISVSPYTQYSMSIGGTNSHTVPAGKRIIFCFIQTSSIIERCGYSDVDIVDGNWHHVVLAANQTDTISLYVDGANVAFTLDYSLGTWPDVSTTAALAIGQVGDGTYFYNGLVDEVAIYNSALTLTQAQAHYAARNCGP
jgi:hypothetical protein